MMMRSYFLSILALCVAVLLPAMAQTPEDYPLAKSYAQYKAIQASLAADDYMTAREAIPPFIAALKSELGEREAPKLYRAAEKFLTADSLQKAREEFADISGRFSNQTDAYPNHGGYFTCVCTSVPGNVQFVQREKDITRCPYGGRANPTCGRVLSQSPKK